MAKPEYHLESQPIPEGFRIFEERLDVAGVGHRRRAASRFVRRGSRQLELRPDPSNRHDSNAIEVWGSSRGFFGVRQDHIGFVPRQIAARIVERGLVDRVKPRLLMTWRKDGGAVEVSFQIVGPISDWATYVAEEFRQGAPPYEYVEHIRSLKSQKRHDEAIELLLRLVDDIEEESERTGHGVAPWYYEQLAIIYRKEKRHADEVAILERYARHRHAPGVGPEKLALRLKKARALSG